MAAASEHTVVQYVASSSTASAISLTLTARISPSVIKKVCETFSIRPPGATRVIGTLLGSILPDGTVDIRNSYAVPHLETSDQACVDFDFYHNTLASFLKMNPEEIVVGWYSTGVVGVNTVSGHIHHSFYARYCANPIYLTVDPGFPKGEGTIKAYVSSLVTLADQRVRTAAMFQEIPVDISVGGEKEQEVVYYDYSFGPQLLKWQKIEREDQKWIDRYERVVHDPYIQLGEGISGHRVPLNHMLCGLDEFYAKLLKPPKLPRDVMMPLLRHQMLFLRWASEQELSVAAGGILGDDIEMGKNIQAIAHVYARREVDRERDREAVGCTLVVTLSVGQWVDDIARCTKFAQ